MSATAPRVKVSAKSALIALGVLVVVVVWLLVFFLPQSRKLDALDAQRTSLQQTVAADQARLQSVKDEAEHVGQIEAMDRHLDSYAPSTEELYTYIHTISAAAKVAGVTITSLSPQGLDAVPGTPYSAIPISASVKGTYDQLLAFVKRIYELPRLTDVNDLSVSGGGPGTTRGTKLTVSLQLAIFTTEHSATAS